MYRLKKTILNLKELGQHYTEQDIKVIDLILSQINNGRLSSNSDVAKAVSVSNHKL